MLLGAFGRRNSTCAGRYLHAALLVSLLLALLRDRIAGRGRHRRHHRPQRPAHPSVDSGWQAGTCNAEPPEPARSSARSRRRVSSSTRRPPTPTGASPSSSSRTNRPGETPVGELKTVRVDLPVGLSVNPGATDRCPLDRLRSRRVRLPASGLAKSAKARSPPRCAAGHPVAADRAGDRSPRLQRRTEAGRGGPLRPRTRRQRSLPRRRRRLVRRLPRGVHDPRAGSSAGSAGRTPRAPGGKKG